MTGFSVLLATAGGTGTAIRISTKNCTVQESVQESVQKTAHGKENSDTEYPVRSAVKNEIRVSTKN